MFGWFGKRGAKRVGAEPTNPPQEEPPPAPDWIARGNAVLREGRLAQAREAYGRAAQADPSNPAAWLNHGFTCLEGGDTAAAEGDFRRCLALAGPGHELHHEAQFLLGRACAAAGRSDEAQAAYEAALAAAPGFEPARAALTRLQLALARSLHVQGRHEQARDVLARLLARDSACIEALDGQGVVLLDLGRPAEALASFERALQAGGPNPDRLANLSAACQRLARLDEAIAHATRALELAPGEARARWNRAVSHLLKGELAQGWEDFEARWEAGVIASDARLRAHAPRWQGESLQGRSILLDMEQGLGDTIQFLRYVPELAARGSQVSVRVQRPIVELARCSLPGATVLAPDDPAPATDFWCELMSVPRHLGIRVDTIPAVVPYLRAEAQAVAGWEARLQAAAQGRLRVGLVWSGNPAHLNDRNRSIPLQQLAALADVDAMFVSLKPDPIEADREAFASWPNLLQAGGELRNFADTAAVVQGLDVVVSVDTSVAHLAGALGRPVWILLPWLPDWRWMLQRADSPWYPTARLYRQSPTQDWAEPLRRLKADLQALAASKSG